MLDHSAFYEYSALFRGGNAVVPQLTPTIGGLLRYVSGYAPMQFLPIAAAGSWFAIQWHRWRASWDWRARLPGLLLVSIVATPYSWFFDQVVLLPSVFFATISVLHSGRRVCLLAAIAYLAVNATVLRFLLDHRTLGWYSWTALAWLLIYIAIQPGKTAANFGASE
jgi:hypothetical protein